MSVRLERQCHVRPVPGFTPTDELLLRISADG